MIIISLVLSILESDLTTCPGQVVRMPVAPLLRLLTWSVCNVRRSWGGGGGKEEEKRNPRNGSQRRRQAAAAAAVVVYTFKLHGHQLERHSCLPLGSASRPSLFQLSRNKILSLCRVVPCRVVAYMSSVWCLLRCVTTTTTTRSSEQSARVQVTTTTTTTTASSSTVDCIAFNNNWDSDSKFECHSFSLFKIDLC